MSNSAEFIAGGIHFNGRSVRGPRGQRPPGHIHRLETVGLPFDDRAANERGVVEILISVLPSDDVPAINDHTRNTGGTRMLPGRNHH